MNILGLGCFFTKESRDFFEPVPAWFYHDAAAALVVGGNVLAACEEERLNRIKHTNKFASHAVKYCLKDANITLNEIDYVAFHVDEKFSDDELMLQMLQHPRVPLKPSRARISELLEMTCGTSFPENKIHFVKHHLAHAFTAYYHSALSDALVVIIDGQGENDAISIFDAAEGGLTHIKKYDELQSLGHLYSSVTEFFGFGLFDEYKVMGLAPYGNPSVYRSLFQGLYTLKAEGDYWLNLAGLRQQLFEGGVFPRRAGEPFNKRIMDLAAALQEVLEIIALHVIEYWMKRLGHSNLCLAGGVAQNCTLNGKLLRHHSVSQLFVHPASHDGGAAIGAGMVLSKQFDSQKFSPRPIRHTFWGPRLVYQGGSIEEKLRFWDSSVSISKTADICHAAAALIAEGHVIGWVQGRSEFGPRALGNRSIIADPRPRENKDRVNLIVKKRESFRPFAPAVMVEEAHRYFDLPERVGECPFMNVTVGVKDSYQLLLGAITHVDGSARLQTVSQADNPQFWRLIREFGLITGVNVLLNTSFNNHAEPIVDSIEDAMTCFLTTGLDYLVIDDFLISKRSDWSEFFMKCFVSLRASVRLSEVQEVSENGAQRETRFEVKFNYTNGSSLAICEGTHRFLKDCDQSMVVSERLKLLCSLFPKFDTAQIQQEIAQLIERRFIRVSWPGEITKRQKFGTG